ncbi:MAG: hypothetical protein IT435_20665 [Phycisphaerales bacterium]|nr:hypothetical protein [Phycisphaerales bacterium]
MPALHVIIAPAFLAALTTLELGACLRLAETAWASEMPGVLLAEDSFLQAVCRTTPAEWTTAKAAVLRALGSAPHTAPESPHDAAGAAAEHLVLQAVRSVYLATAADVDAKTAKAAEISAKRRAAGQAGASSRWQSDGKGMANAIGLLSAAHSLRPVFNQVSSALAPTPKPERAIQSAPEGDVCAVLGEGARALLEVETKAWRRKKALGLLQPAIARWAAAGLTTCPVSKASEIVAGEHATPARVQFLIEEADATIEREKTRKRSCNPVGIVIGGLGQSEKSRGIPREVPLQLEQHWATTEAATLKLLEAQAAINARLRTAQAQLGSSTTPQVGADRHAFGGS